MLRCRGCPGPLTLRGTQALVSFAPLAFELFLRRSSQRCSSPLALSAPVKTFLSRSPHFSPRSDERFRLGLISYQKANDEPLVTVLGAYKCEVA